MRINVYWQVYWALGIHKAPISSWDLSLHVVCVGAEHKQCLTFPWFAAKLGRLLEFPTRKFLGMGKEPKLPCASDSQMKTIHFRVVLVPGIWRSLLLCWKSLDNSCWGFLSTHNHKGSQFILHRFPTVLQGTLVNSWQNNLSSLHPGDDWHRPELGVLGIHLFVKDWLRWPSFWVRVAGSGDRWLP